MRPPFVTSRSRSSTTTAASISTSAFYLSVILLVLPIAQALYLPTNTNTNIVTVRSRSTGARPQKALIIVNQASEMAPTFQPPSSSRDDHSITSSLPAQLQPFLRPADAENLKPDDSASDQKQSSPATKTRNIKQTDLIGKTTSISIFGSFIRQSDKIFRLLDGDTPTSVSVNTDPRFIVLAPVNGAITRLPRIPWKTEDDLHRFGISAYEGVDGQARADRNMEKFVRKHIIPLPEIENKAGGGWSEGVHAQSLATSPLWYEIRDGVKYIQPGDIQVLSVTKSASNGELWTIDSTLPDN